MTATELAVRVRKAGAGVQPGEEGLTFQAEHKEQHAAEYKAAAVRAAWGPVMKAERSVLKTLERALWPRASKVRQVAGVV